MDSGNPFRNLFTLSLRDKLIEDEFNATSLKGNVD